MVLCVEVLIKSNLKSRSHTHYIKKKERKKKKEEHL